ncbi:hypothetical protein [Microbacterium sp. NPDC064584]|uniref:hypothetical protein n=1 Tax=Microbacterium sp. NPDC064584 TaxID=3155817 RepID=UPI003413AC6A
MTGTYTPDKIAVPTKYDDVGQITEARWMTQAELDREIAKSAPQSKTARDPRLMDATERHAFAAGEYLALQRAREKWPPPCEGDPRFVADLDIEASAEIADLCANVCRIRAQCMAYADKARPPAGVWAGFRFSHPESLLIAECKTCGHEVGMHRPLSGCFVRDCSCGKPEIYTATEGTP